MDKKQVIENYNSCVVGSYTKSGMVFVRGEGSYLWDIEGREYLDFFPGWAVSGLGHCHPRVVNAIREQCGNLIHIANNHYNPWQGVLAKKLSELSFGGKAFFCNSGAEANETAIKLVRLYGRRSGRYKILSMENSFHGRTLATAAMTGQPKYNEPFKPLPEGFSYVPFNDFEALKKAVDEKTAAIIIEPVQGEGGVNIVDKDYIVKVESLCKEKDILLIFDEVQTGLGRTGEMFAYKLFGVTPDIMTLAKTLGGGFPIGAALAKRDVADLMVPGTHASTFGGSPLACRSALGVIEAIEEDKLLENVKTTGDYLREKLETVKSKYPFISRIKGIGLMLAIETEKDCSSIVEECALKGLLINCTQGKILRIMPAITTNKAEIDKALDILEKCLASFN